ncbi:hypothetical protein [Bradyrhizobium sp. LMG 9283]|uniref:hypothetical protein n=1 Tax=Bradyrhizobium sp. LMG 9283 TaxID=592064 RepID=UPI00388EFDE8
MEMKRILAILVCCSVFAALAGVELSPSARAQTATTAPSSSLTLQGPADQAGASVIRDALGRPCLDVEAAARAHTVNPEMLDHVVSLKNNCPRIIRVKVCYFNSDRCNDVVIQGYKRADTILGTMRGAKFFRYSMIQK